MKDYQGMKIIGIDNGYGNIKTANCCFPAGLTAHDAEPVFKDDLLVYDGRYYLIGTGHKEFKADKTGDDDYYILTLAAIARELNVYGLADATVYLAVGLPLTWVSRQREDFKAYLMRNRKQYIIKPYNPCGSKRFLYAFSRFPPPFPPLVDLVPSNKAIPLWSVELSLWV